MGRGYFRPTEIQSAKICPLELATASQIVSQTTCVETNDLHRIVWRQTPSQIPIGLCVNLDLLVSVSVSVSVSASKRHDKDPFMPNESEGERKRKIALNDAKALRNLSKLVKHRFMSHNDNKSGFPSTGWLFVR